MRGFLSAIQGDFVNWLKGAWIDISILAAIVLLSVFYWAIYSYSIDDNGIIVKYGLIFRRNKFVPIYNITTISIVEPLWLRLFKAAVFRADTIAGSVREADFSVILGKKTAEEYYNSFGEDDKKYISREYKPKQKYIFAMSLIMSNSFAGIILFATFISQAGVLLGQEFKDQIYGTFEELTMYIPFNIPRAAAAAAYIILIGWLISFMFNIVRHKNFSVRRKANSLLVHGGVFTNRSYSIKYDDIAYVDIRQSLLTKILGLYSVFACAAGFGKLRGDVSAIVPAAQINELEQIMRLLLPEYKHHKRKIKPNTAAIFRFINDALIFCVLIPAAAIWLGYLFYNLQDLIYFAGLICSVPAYWLLIIRLWDYATSGIAKNEDDYTLNYSSGFYLHTIIIHRDKIVKVCFRQSIMQRIDNSCDVIIYSAFEKEKKHLIKNLNLDECKTLFST